MKHDLRLPVFVAASLIQVGAWAQDGLGPAHDSEAFATPIELGSLEIAAAVSAPPVTRSFEADFYGETDVNDWYRVTLRDEAIDPSCFFYRQRFEAQVLDATPPPPPSAQILVTVYLNANQIAGPDLIGAPQYARIDRDASSCGMQTSYVVNVRRTPGIPTPLRYTLKLTLAHEFLSPGISAISPASGPVGTSVTITGVQLLPEVVFQGNAATLTSFTPSSITTTVPEGATTGPIKMGAATSNQVFTVTTRSRTADNTVTAPGTNTTGQRGPTSVSLPQTALPPAPNAGSCCTTLPNPALAGRLGRLVVAFPANADPSGTRIVVLKDGQELQAGYGSQTWDLLAGTYDVSIGGKVVSGVSVQARSDTNVRVGVLRVSAGGQTRAEVVDGGAVIVGGYGEQVLGLPVGAYALRISGQTESFSIQEGQVTDF